jgi:two-component system phosphate regulon sensor histidine kinase PhoR
MVMSSSQIALLRLLEIPAMLVRDQRVIYANPAAIALLGSHIVDQDVRLAIRTPEAVNLLTSGEGGQIRVKGLSVAGSVWSLSAQQLDATTQLVTLDDQSIQASVARAHADFVANASHELRTPLAAVLGYVETLENPKAGEDPTTRARFLSIIRKEALRMEALVEDLMSLSRIEANKHEAPNDPVELVALANASAGELRSKGEVNVHANTPKVTITGDRSQIAQVLRNLIDNGLKYGKPGGPVHVNIEATHTGWVSITIRDEGEGIGPEHLPRLTERFYRVDTGRSRQAGGTGLGLSIVKHIVERHRGRFDISSRSGEGTTATIMLPVADSMSDR